MTFKYVTRELDTNYYTVIIILYQNWNDHHLIQKIIWETAYSTTSRHENSLESNDEFIKLHHYERVLKFSCTLHIKLHLDIGVTMHKYNLTFQDNWKSFGYYISFNQWITILSALYIPSRNIALKLALCKNMFHSNNKTLIELQKTIIISWQITIVKEMYHYLSKYTCENNHESLNLFILHVFNLTIKLIY